MSIKLKRLVIGDAEVNWTDYSGTEKLTGLVTVEKATFFLSLRLFSILNLPFSNHSSLLQYSDEFSFSIIWLLQVLSLKGLTHILRHEIIVQNDVFWVHTHLSFCRINLAASFLSHFPFFFSFQLKKHQTVQWSPMVTATSASEAQRRRAVPKTLSPVQTVDAQVGLRWRGWMAGGRRSTVDEIFNFGNTHLVLNKQRKLGCYNTQNGRTIPVGFCVCFSLLQICFNTWLLFCFYLESNLQIVSRR